LANLIQTLLVFAVVLGVLVVVHELGHFIVAKLFGIRVDVFSVGFGKRLFGLKKGDTDYRVSLIPLGGYVKMAGENLDEEVTGAADEFMSKPKWQRFCVAVAGPAMNILTAVVILSGMKMFQQREPAYLNKPALIKAVDADSPAAAAGIQPGDLIVKIDGRENPTWRDVRDQVWLSADQNVPVSIKRGESVKNVVVYVASRIVDREKIGYNPGFLPEDAHLIVKDVTEGLPGALAGLRPGDEILAINGSRVERSLDGQEEVIRVIQSSNGQPVSLKVTREGETLELTGTPQMLDGAYRLGIMQELTGLEWITIKLGVGEAVKQGIDESWRILRLTKEALVQVLTGKRSARDTFQGPIGIARMSGQAAEQGAFSVLQLSALISLNLGVFNLFPIPVLDGGLIFMLLLEAVLGLFGRPLTLRIKEKMMQVGFVVLVLLMGFVIFNDISKSLPSSSNAPQQTQQPQEPGK
jgi:regulator of sigma E protease